MAARIPDQHQVVSPCPHVVAGIELQQAIDFQVAICPILVVMASQLAALRQAQLAVV
jgi:hypothetical protein